MGHVGLVYVCGCVRKRNVSLIGRCVACESRHFCELRSVRPVTDKTVRVGSSGDVEVNSHLRYGWVLANVDCEVGVGQRC